MCRFFYFIFRLIESIQICVRNKSYSHTLRGIEHPVYEPISRSVNAIFYYAEYTIYVLWGGKVYKIRFWQLIKSRDTSVFQGVAGINRNVRYIFSHDIDCVFDACLYVVTKLFATRCYFVESLRKTV